MGWVSRGEDSRTHIVVRVLDGIAHQVLAEVLGGILDTTNGLQWMHGMGGEDPKKTKNGSANEGGFQLGVWRNEVNEEDGVPKRTLQNPKL